MLADQSPVSLEMRNVMTLYCKEGVFAGVLSVGLVRL